MGIIVGSFLVGSDYVSQSKKTPVFLGVMIYFSVRFIIHYTLYTIIHYIHIFFYSYLIAPVNTLIVNDEITRFWECSQLLVKMRRVRQKNAANMVNSFFNCCKIASKCFTLCICGVQRLEPLHVCSV